MKEKNLTVNDIVLGDYVQEWLKIPGKWGTPMYIDGIFGNGDLYLNLDGNDGDPFDANIKDVYDIPIDLGILPHFGFVQVENHVFTKEVGKWKLSLNVTKILDFYYSVLVLTQTPNRRMIIGEAFSIRDIQHFFYEQTHEPLKLNFE